MAAKASLHSRPSSWLCDKAEEFIPGLVDSLVFMVMVVSVSSLNCTRLKSGDVEGFVGDDEVKQAGLKPVAPVCVGLGAEALAVAAAVAVTGLGFVRGRPLGRGLLYTHCTP